MGAPRRPRHGRHRPAQRIAGGLLTALVWLAAVLAAAVAVAHSVLGERYILTRLLRREDLPQLFGSQEFTVQTLRFAWHLTSIAWIGFAGLLALLARGAIDDIGVANVIGITFMASGVLTLLMSKGRHLAWPVFLAIGMIALLTTV